jgi:hypothetical protein
MAALPEGLLGSLKNVSAVSDHPTHGEIFRGAVKRKALVSHDAYGTGKGNHDSASGRRQIGLKPGYLRHTRRRYQPFVPVNPAPGALATQAAAGGVPPERNPGTYAPRGCHAARYEQRRCPQTPAASQTRYANQRTAPARRFLSSRDWSLVPWGRAGRPRHAASIKASACLRELDLNRAKPSAEPPAPDG